MLAFYRQGRPVPEADATPMPHFADSTKFRYRPRQEPALPFPGPALLGGSSSLSMNEGIWK
jgi:hypothetical protein